VRLVIHANRPGLSSRESESGASKRVISGPGREPAPAFSWPVKQPRWVSLAGPGLAAAALAGAAYCLPLPYVVTIGLSLWWAHERDRRVRAVAASGTLSLAPDGRWQWTPPCGGAGQTGLRLIRVWAGPAWVGLRFARQDGPDSKEIMLQVTLWKSCVPLRNWRRLQVCLADCIARPGAVATQGAR
jgi:hypothetical protein